MAEHKKQYQVNLDQHVVEKAKEIQMILARAENLSLLVNSLLIEWVMQMGKVIEEQQRKEGM